MKLRRQSGMTLIEVVIASIILVVVLYAVFLVLFSSTEHATNGSISGDLEYRAQAFIEEFNNMFKMVKVTNIAVDHSSIEFQILVDHDGDGDVTDAVGTNEYGILSPLTAPWDGQRKDWYARLIFEPNIVYREPNGPTPALGVTVETVKLPLNRDPQDNDALVSGTVWLEYYASPADVAAFPGGNPVHRVSYAGSTLILQVHDGTGYGADLDEDGDSDFLFQVIDINGNDVAAANITASGAGLMLNPWFGNFGYQRKSFLLRNKMQGIRLRNKS